MSGMATQIRLLFKSYIAPVCEVTDRNTIEELEQIACESWMARETRDLGGWLLRANDGITRRANSVFPLADPECDLDEALNQVIEFYNSRGILPRFQMTEISIPTALDDFLVSQGWTYGLEVYIEVSPIKTVIEKPTELQVELLSTPSSDWMDAYILASEHKECNPNIRRELMLRSPLNKVFAAGKIDDTIAGVGIGVVSGDWVGLFSIGTLHEYRRRQVATDVSREIAAWGLDQGATRSYLQVETRNEPANKMYSRLGFKPCYNYWYRDYHNEN